MRKLRHTGVTCLKSDSLYMMKQTKVFGLQSLYSFFKKSVFIYFEREREQGRGRERERERGTQDSKQALCWQQRAQCGAWTHELWDHDLSWNQETGAQLIELPRHPCNKTFNDHLYFSYLSSSLVKLLGNEQNQSNDLVGKTPWFLK